MHTIKICCIFLDPQHPSIGDFVSRNLCGTSLLLFTIFQTMDFSVGELVHNLRSRFGAPAICISILYHLVTCPAFVDARNWHKHFILPPFVSFISFLCVFALLILTEIAGKKCFLFNI